MKTTVLQREEIDLNARWDMESIYASHEQWEADFQTIEKQLPGLEQFRGNLGQNAETLLTALEMRDAINQQLRRLYVYAFMRLHENLRNTASQALADRVTRFDARVKTT